MLDADFATLIEGWPEENLTQAVTEFVNDYPASRLVLVLAEFRRRGLAPPAGLAGLEPGSVEEREALEALQDTRVEEIETSRARGKKWTIPLVLGVVVLVAVAFFSGADGLIAFLIAVPVIACAVVANMLFNGATEEGLGAIFRGDLD